VVYPGSQQVRPHGRSHAPPTPLPVVYPGGLPVVCPGGMPVVYPGGLPVVYTGGMPVVYPGLHPEVRRWDLPLRRPALLALARQPPGRLPVVRQPPGRRPVVYQSLRSGAIPQGPGPPGVHRR